MEQMILIALVMVAGIQAAVLFSLYLVSRRLDGLELKTNRGWSHEEVVRALELK